MKFKSGYLGICIVVLSLLLGTAGSLLLNVDKDTEPSTKYDYKTDITGLFNTSQEPQYIDFNPATNITGYTPQFPADSPNPTGLDYVPSSTTNNYRVLAQDSTPVNGPSGTVNNSTSLPQASLTYPVNSSVGSSERVNGSALTARLSGQKVTTLYNWVTSVWDLSTYSEIEITLSYPALHAPTQRAGFGIAIDIPASDPYTSVTNGHYDTIKVFSDNLTFQYYHNGAWSPANSLYDYYMIYGDATQRENYYSGGNPTVSDYSTSLSLSYTSRMTPRPNYEYIDPTQGVSIATGYNSPVIWDNDTITTDYDNYVVSFVLGPSMTDGTPDASNYWLSEFRYYDNNSNETQIDIKHDVSGGVGKIYATCTVWQSPNTYYPIPNNTFLGNYDYVLLTLDIRGTPTLTIYPIVDFINYTNFSALDAPIASVSVTSNGTPDLDKIYIYSSGSPRGRWLVSDTTLFLNTYNSVLIDPSIDLANYWPDMNSYRYAFQSFALYGDSITINGVTYPIIEDNKIEINGKKYTLDNFYLSYSEQNTVSITFKNINRTVELGDIDDKTVSFSGIWYFSTGLYEGSYTTSDTYKWDDNLIGNINPQIVLLLTLGLLLGLSLLFIALFKVNVGTMDKLILIFAGVVIICILGGL